MHVKRNTAAHSCNYGNGKTISITYYPCVFVALVIQHGMRRRIIAICGPSDSNIYFHIVSQRALFRKKKILMKIKVRFDFP
jgi:hypothetical protein